MTTVKTLDSVKEEMKEKLSASKLKTFESCSLKFLYNYHHKVPQKNNEGNLVGDCVHIVLESLARKSHRHIFEELISKGVAGCGVVKRYIDKYMRRARLSESSFIKAAEFIELAIKQDFFCEGGLWLKVEQDFDIISASPKYRIQGFIDQVAEYPNGWIRIKDFKTQKKKFEGKDATNNLQAMMYSLAASKLYGRDKNICVDFVMLNFPQEPIFRVRPDVKTLGELESYLAEMYRKVTSFSDKDKFSNVAALKHPQTGDGFTGKLQCGWNFKNGFVLTPEQKKKDGSPAYYCPYKFKFSYYALCDDSATVLKTSLENDLKADESIGQFVIRKTHPGCAAFNQTSGLPFAPSSLRKS